MALFSVYLPKLQTGTSDSRFEKRALFATGFHGVDFYSLCFGSFGIAYGAGRWR